MLFRSVGNLLDITRLEAGSLDFKREMADLAEIIETALRRATRVLAHHRVAVDLEADLPLVNIDAALFEQALFNLLDNAAKYTPGGSVVGIRAHRSPAGVAVDVEDEGEGIPPDQLERIFDKFHRAHDGDGRPVGTGLGLAICRGFIEGIGGHVVAANRSDRQGARFTITLPIQVAVAAPLVQDKV